MTKNEKCLYLFYEEPDPDRWIKHDRYVRKIIRRIFRGPEPIGGVKRWFLNLTKGLDQLGQAYRLNDYTALKKNPNLWALVVGKPQVIEKIPEQNSIIFGPAVSAHPFDNDFWERRTNIKHLLISCDWFKKMYDRDLPVKIPTSIWPSGVDLAEWEPVPNKQKNNSILIYDKIRWEWEVYNNKLIEPIAQTLKHQNITTPYIKYGSYKEEDFKHLLTQVDAMIFLCEHETQGFAYLQALACDVPILAWDRGGYWQDPSMFPEKVKFAPVTSVPYWDNRCGEKFIDYPDFSVKFDTFWEGVNKSYYNPKDYVIENFKLEDRALAYVNLVEKIMNP